MSYHHYTWRDTLAASERVGWRVEELIGGEKKLDFARPFMPQSLARVDRLDFLSPQEKLVLNQVRGHEYLAMFGLVEEAILPFVLDHTRPSLSGDDYRVRAMLQFAEEEAKHIHLFKCFREAFQVGFGQDCPTIGPAEAIAAEILSKRPLGVALAILQIEWMTQGHYIESVKDDRDLDPLFKDLLRHHWMEEAQHAKLDTLVVERIADGLTQAEIEAGFADYGAIGRFLDGGLVEQTQLNLQAFQQATGRTLDPAEADAFTQEMLQAARWTYLGSGMTHRNFLATLEGIWPEARRTVEAMAPAFC